MKYKNELFFENIGTIIWLFISVKMMKLSIFLVVFISTCFFVQDTVQQLSESQQCQCCEHCDQSGTVSRILLDISNLLDGLSSNLVTNNTSLHSTSTTASPSTQTIPTTTGFFTTTNPSTEVSTHPSTEAATHPSTETLTHSPTETVTHPSTTTGSHTTTTGYPTTTTTTDFATTHHLNKIFICLENCYISGDYCNCYPPDAAEPLTLMDTNL